MATDNNKINQLNNVNRTLFSCVFSRVFNISYLHANANLPNRHFSHEQILTSKSLSILHALLYSQSHLLGS